MYRIIVLLLVCGVVLPACETLDKGKELEAAEDEEGVPAPTLPEEGLPLSPQQRFKDIPLPAHLDADFERTYVFETEALQVGRMVYWTKASPTSVARFFIKECPAADWKLESVLQADDVWLVFRKPGKRLDVTIRRGGLWEPKQLLVLNLTPDTGVGM